MISRSESWLSFFFFLYFSGQTQSHHFYFCHVYKVFNEKHNFFCWNVMIESTFCCPFDDSFRRCHSFEYMLHARFYTFPKFRTELCVVKPRSSQRSEARFIRINHWDGSLVLFAAFSFPRIGGYLVRTQKQKHTILVVQMVTTSWYCAWESYQAFTFMQN